MCVNSFNKVVKFRFTAYNSTVISAGTGVFPLKTLIK